jgi:hypothetical protein
VLRQIHTNGGVLTIKMADTYADEPIENYSDIQEEFLQELLGEKEETIQEESVLWDYS